jgi:hypothetical protein
MGSWSGYTLQVLAPFAFAQAAVGFTLLSLPETQNKAFTLKWGRF